MRLPSQHDVQGALLVVLGCALIVGLSRDVPSEARGAGQVGAMVALGAMVVLHAGAARRAVS